MRYELSIKENVRDLRKKGKSLLVIHSLTGIPVTTITTWIKDIALTPEQKNELKIKVHNALQRGRVIAQNTIKKKRDLLQNNLFLEGKNDTSVLTDRELFLIGIALYWGEGFKNKHEHRLGFCNSDPKMIKLYIYWLEKSLGILKEKLVLRLTLNESYKGQTAEIQLYWSLLTGISLEQFTMPFYQKVKWQKQYDNNNYKGVLRIHVKESLHLLWKMKGWIEGLKTYSE